MSGLSFWFETPQQRRTVGVTAVVPGIQALEPRIVTVNQIECALAGMRDNAAWTNFSIGAATLFFVPAMIEKRIPLLALRGR